MFIFAFQDESLRSNYLLLRDLDNNVLKDTLDGRNTKKFAKEKLNSLTLLKRIGLFKR